MPKPFFENFLICPKCKTPFLNPKIERCRKCNLVIKKEQDVWLLNYSPSKKTSESQLSYDKLHKKFNNGPSDGSYEILSSIARGNKTLDIACGEGHIEKLAPETVGVDFSFNALKKAHRFGAKYLVHANSEYLPFKSNSFDISISNGSLEHFENPQKALNEMARISKIQILVVHKEFGFPGARFLRKYFGNLIKLENQPIESPLTKKQLERLVQKAKLKTVYKGEWTFPINYGHAISILPTINIPSCYFWITIKHKERK